MGSRGKGSNTNKKELKFQKKLLRFFKQNPNRTLNYKQLSSVMEAEDNYEKQRIRQFKYDRIENQLDQLWHDINDNKLDKTGSWFKSIKAVKDANPNEYSMAI